jgi:hypothetical protein
MRRQTSTVRFDGPALAAALVCTILSLWPSGARSDVPLYEVTVTLGGPTDEDRTKAFAEALQAAVVKASGRRSAASSAAVTGADPARYVQRYAKTADQRLKVGLDGGAVEELLQQAGLPVWPSERPVTVVAADGADRAEIERAAAWRGLPISWASGGTALDPGSVVDGARAMLIGVPGATGFVWSFRHAGQTTEARGSAQDGVHLAADTLAAYYAPTSTRTSSGVAVSVGGIRDVTAYAGLISYLKSLSLVRGVVVEALAGDVVRLRLTVRGDRELLTRIAALENRLQPASRSAEPLEPADAGLDFLYQP